jgi:hypothetical protein
MKETWGERGNLKSDEVNCETQNHEILKLDEPERSFSTAVQFQNFMILGFTIYFVRFQISPFAQAGCQARASGFGLPSGLERSNDA